MTSRSGSFDQNAGIIKSTVGARGNAQILIDGAPSTAIDWGGLLFLHRTTRCRSNRSCKMFTMPSTSDPGRASSR